MNAQKVQQLIEEGLPGSMVQVKDAKSSGRHYNIMIVTDQFDGVRLIDRHKMVHSALGDNLGSSIHAVEIAAYTTKQWEDK